jgi:hypothetical protein
MLEALVTTTKDPEGSESEECGTRAALLARVDG